MQAFPPKTRGLASRGWCANSALNPQGLPSPSSASGTFCYAACQLYFSFPNQRWSVPADTKRGLGDAVVLQGRRLTACSLPWPGSTQPGGDGQALKKESLQSTKVPFFPPRVDLKLILCLVPSPHINPTAAECQCGVWTEASLPCYCLPNICRRCCIALLWSFPVPPTTIKQHFNRENPFHFEHSSNTSLLWPPRKCS